MKPFEAELLNNQIQDEHAGDENEYDTAEQSFSACSFEEVHNPVNNKPDKKQFNGNNQPIILRDSAKIIDDRFHKSNPFEEIYDFRFFNFNGQSKIGNCQYTLGYPFVG